MALADRKYSRQALIEAYKATLRGCIDKRPSGLRRKLAEVLGTHKSFISQITNPSDPTPIPSRHLDAIIDVCHLSPAERKQFLDAYRDAHPDQLAPDAESHRHFRTLHIQIPALKDPRKQQALETLIRDTVRRLCELMEQK